VRALSSPELSTDQCQPFRQSLACRLTSCVSAAGDRVAPRTKEMSSLVPAPASCKRLVRRRAEALGLSGAPRVPRDPWLGRQRGVPSPCARYQERRAASMLPLGGGGVRRMGGRRPGSPRGSQIEHPPVHPLFHTEQVGGRAPANGPRLTCGRPACHTQTSFP